MFGSTMICWRSMMAITASAEKRKTFKLMSHSSRDEEIFERRRKRLADAEWQAWNKQAKRHRLAA